MTGPAPPTRHLAGRRFLARAVISFEVVWLALWPPLAVVGVFLCLAMLDVPQRLPGWAHVALLVVVVLAAGGLLLRGLLAGGLPDDRAADRRLESQSGLTHRPLAVLTEKPSRADNLSLALWDAHRARSVTQIGRLRVGGPRPGLARRDPRALRYALLLCVVASLGIANSDAPSRLYTAVTPSLPPPLGVPSTRLQAWITPPAYTRIAPIFLKAEGGTVSVPAGSHLTVNVSGDRTAPVLWLNERSDPFTSLDHSSFQADLDLTRGGVLTVKRDGTSVAVWTLTVIADQPPTIGWGGNPGRQPHSQETRLPWEVSDDYGVTNLQAELHLRDRTDAPPLLVTIPMPGGSAKSAHGISRPDLNAHPWAGLTVTGRLIGRDASGQTGASEERAFDLPERPFHHPVSRSLIAARKTLSLHPDDRGDALEALDELLQRPDLFAGDLGAFTALSGIYYELARNHTGSAVSEAQEMMWQLALHMEEGQTEQSARSLEAARQAARDAMDKAQEQPNDENRKYLAKKLEELREAIDRHMRALMEEAQRNNNVMPFDPKAKQLSAQVMETIAEQAEQAAKDGRMADARQQMAQLEKMLDQLRNARLQGDEGKQASSKQQRGKRQQSVVQDLVARQGSLLDHAQRRGSKGPSARDPAAEREADNQVQRALRRGLGELMQQFTDLTGEASPALGEADQAMRDAATSLDQHEDGVAGERQQQAIAALQKGNQELGQAMARMGQQPGRDQEGEDGQDGDGGEGTMGMMMLDGHQGDGRGTGPLTGSPDEAGSEGRDPLGRVNPRSMTDNADATVPEERERQRTQAIQEELRRRGADRARPRQELDYIDRLLKQF